MTGRLTMEASPKKLACWATGCCDMVLLSLLLYSCTNSSFVSGCKAVARSLDRFVSPYRAQLQTDE